MSDITKSQVLLCECSGEITLNYTVMTVRVFNEARGECILLNMLGLALASVPW